MAGSACSLGRSLAALGVKAGDKLIVHVSLRRVGQGPGTAASLYAALRAAIAPGGTFLVPAFYYGAEDPAGWVAPPLPPEEVVERQLVARPYHGKDTPIDAELGYFPRYVQAQPESHRSHHWLSFLAVGAQAMAAVAQHTYDYPLGPRSPVGWLYRHGGKVLMLGTDFTTNTAFHLAECLAPSSYVHETWRRVLVAPGQWRWCRGMPFCSEAFPRLLPWVSHCRVGEGHVGGAWSELWDMSCLIETVRRAFEADPLRGVCDRPDCRCCQDRRDLLAGRLSGIHYGTGEPA